VTGIFHSIVSLIIKHLWRIRKRHLPPLLDARGCITPEAKKVIKKILITRFQCVGDMILFIPTLKGLRRLFPEAYICLLAFEPSGIETIKACPYIDNIIAFRSGDILKEKWFHRYYLRKQNFDMFISSCAEINILREGFYSGAKYIIGFKGKKRFDQWVIEAEPYLLDIALDYDTEMHETYQNLKIIEKLGGRPEDIRLEYYVREGDTRHIENLFESFQIDPGRPLVGIHSGSKQKAKRWSAERFSELADFIIEKHHAQIVFVGGKEETSLIQSIIAQMKNGAVNLCGMTTLGEIAALLKKIDLFVCNDSGPMHIAAALGVQLVALYGPGNFANWHPLAEEGKTVVIRHPVECGPCFAVSCDKPICMDLITVDEVKNATDRFLMTHVSEGVQTG
jgi:lipopolysaccharide heptosyltransferase II